MKLADVLAPELELLRETDRFRVTPILEGKGTRRLLGETPLLVFASNDYLGLAAHPAVAAAAAHAAATWGTGSSGARLVTGAFPLQDRLERELARFLGLPSALLFPSGYQANVGLLTALADQSDLIVSDALNHASIIDGCRLSRANVRVYRHADAGHAATLLASPGTWRRKFLVTESLFSMDGDQAPLTQLAEAAARHDAHLLVDEAHALGTQGPGGRGHCAAQGIVPAALIATLGKSLGAGGAFVAGTDVLRSLLVNRARSFVFTTAPPPPSIAAALEALGILETQGALLLSKLHLHAQRLRTAQLGFGSFLGHETSPILPLVLGSESRALAFAALLKESGIFAPAIRPPTVPEGSCRIRFTLSASHTDDDLNRLLGVLVGQPSITR